MRRAKIYIPPTLIRNIRKRLMCVDGNVGFRSSFVLVDDAVAEESSGAFGELVSSIEGEVEDILDTLPETGR